ncbi:MAG: flavin reductase family protein [Azospirillaceae bacterium]
MKPAVDPSATALPEQDLVAYRQALGRFTTGVTVMTCQPPHGGPIGVTVNSFTSLSLAPPLVLFCLREGGGSLASFLDAGAFAVNVLSRDQRAVSIRFARDIGDWQDVAYHRMVTGSPVLAGNLATLDCRLEADHRGGDHRILVGRVLGFENSAAQHVDPLLYDRGRYASLGPFEP